MTTYKDDDSFPSALQVRELNHVAIYVRDLEVATQFYGEVLGFPLLPRPAFGFPGAWFALGKQELHLIVSTQEETRHAVHFALVVEDAHATYAELLRRGVTSVRPPGLRPDGAVQVFLHDPDGYEIEFTSFPAEWKTVAA